MTDQAYRVVGCVTTLLGIALWLGIIYMAWWGWHLLGRV